MAITNSIHYPLPSVHPLHWRDHLVHPKPKCFPDPTTIGFLDTLQQPLHISAAGPVVGDGVVFNLFPHILAAGPVASDVVEFNPSFLINSEPTSAAPSISTLTHPPNHADDVTQHLVITSSHHRLQESRGASCLSCQGTRLAKTKSSATTSSSTLTMELRLIPYGIPGFLCKCKELIKVDAFCQMLLPSPDSLCRMVKSSWDILTRSLTDDQILKLKPILIEILDNVKLVVEGVIVNIAFANPAILTTMSYLLHDSEHQYHWYIRDNLNVKLFFAIMATFCQWALEERSTKDILQACLYLN
ncbi:uncharacterized protein F5147DRAFT_649666 [Suillus discolor]|uniref:Uncharacterized protein n=1 Tax=Suillus discolor TaxID=1912936 RepID=A0A9P7FF69_9AGAM|nr:uncharacterized protein F5147DRAFT_649666 [Suillus discolor]KAG2115284.1 hypothetical protein F5147DRAFT_649666 [Suillus discolor]